jgi:anti-sigma factor RsiW
MEKRDCFVNEEEIFLYLDKELDINRAELLDRHLKTCHSCDLRFQIYSQLKAMTRARVSIVKAPDSLRLKVQNQINSAIIKPHYNFWENIGVAFRGRPLIPIGAIAVLVILLFGAVSLIPHRGNTMPLVTAMVHEHYEYMKGFEGSDGIKSCDADQIAEWVSSHSGVTMGLKSCKKPLALVGACALDEDEYQATCIFLEEDAKRVTLFLLKDQPKDIYGPKTLDVNSTEMLYGRCTDMNYVAWQEQGIFYILVGDLPEQSLLDLADNIT